MIFEHNTILFVFDKVNEKENKSLVITRNYFYDEMEDNDMKIKIIGLK